MPLYKALRKKNLPNYKSAPLVTRDLKRANKYAGKTGTVLELETNQAKELDSLTFQELRKLAKEKNVSGYSKMNKAELIESFQ